MSNRLTRRGFLKLLGATAYSIIIPALPTEAKKDSPTLEKRISQYKIGDTGKKIEVRLLQKPGSIITYFNMHDNENTAVEAAEQVVKEYGGRLIELMHSGTRNIVFYLDGQKYQFDPNRIFTNIGIRKTLQDHKNYNKAAHEEVKKFSDWLLKQYSLNQSTAMVAVHNNTDNNYSIQSYCKGGIYESETKKINISEGQDYDDFFFVTTLEHFNYFAKLGFNVVLQNNEKVTDDGSLSVYWGKEKKRPYINIETQDAHLEQQIKMMTAVIGLYKNSKQDILTHL